MELRGAGGGGHDIHFGLFKAPTDGVYESSKHTTDFMCHSMDWASPVRLPGAAPSHPQELLLSSSQAQRSQLNEKGDMRTMSVTRQHSSPSAWPTA